MTHTIEALWNGEISPCDQCGVHDPQTNELFVSMGKHRDHLSESLNEEQRSVFEQYIDCSEDYLLRLMKHAFSDGFSLASRLLTEALTDGG